MNKNQNRIPYGAQDINDQDIKAVNEVLKSEFLTQGPLVPKFEEKVSQYCGSRFGVAVNSATSALHIACLALNVGKGDVVWTSPNTFVASSNCALYCGAIVDFVDIDSKTYNISIERLSDKLVEAEKNGTLPKVVIPVHLTGQSCDMKKIFDLSKKYGFKIIEDASHAIGGKYDGDYVGNCRYSDITVFSFHPVKIITTCEGGMAMTNDAHLNKRLQYFRTHGITGSFEQMEPRPKDEIWNYQQIELGYNYRMTDIQAALGISQMNRLDSFVKKRHMIASRYNTLLSDLPVVLPFQSPDTYSSFHLYVIRLKLNKIKKSQPEIFKILRAKNIMVNLHYIPVYRHPYYRNMGFGIGYCAESESYFKEAITIPLYPGLTTENQDFVVHSLKIELDI